MVNVTIFKNLINNIYCNNTPFLGLLFLISKYYNKEIQNIALQQINKQLKQPIDAETIRLNAFSQFPSITLEFNNFKIKDPLNTTDTLIFFGKRLLKL